MNASQADCNYAILRFLPYPETGEFVNAGVLVVCLEPCLLHFVAELEMSERMKAMFPGQNQETYAAAIKQLEKDMKREQVLARGPKGCQLAFQEFVRPRESTFRFGEPRTILTSDPRNLAEELFKRYVRMETPERGTVGNVAAHEYEASSILREEPPKA